MSPEELEAIMADIASANTRYGKRVDRIRERIRKMRSVIIQQKAQIEALKEKLVEQLAKYFVLQQAQCTFRTPIKGSMMSKCDKGVICDWNVCPIKDKWEEQARQQLKAEMPEVEW